MTQHEPKRRTTELDRYRILQRVYEGEYSVIFTALHNLLGAQMALKRISRWIGSCPETSCG